MKLFPLFICLGCFLGLSSEAKAADDAGLRFIQTRGSILCGTDLQSKSFAYKDEDGFWHGIDVDFCKALSFAIFNRGDRFKMVDVKPENVYQALNNHKIDVMMSGASFSAKDEISYKFMPADLMYYDAQSFLARNIPNATSMEAYKGAKVCVVSDSNDYNNVLNFSNTYKLDFNLLTFKLKKRAEEAFLLNRCQLLTGNFLTLKSIKDNRFKDTNDVVLLPEAIAIRPIYATVAKDNNSLRIIVKWVFNALKLAEEHDINSKNISVFIGEKDLSLQNLLGDKPQLWKKFALNPNWFRKAIADIGNYGEIYERNLGSESKLNMERKENNLIKNGGLIISEPFL